MKKSNTRKSTTRKLKKPSHSTRNIALISIFIVALAYFTISSIPKQAPAPIGINEVGVASAATVSLSFPATITSELGAETSADIMIDSGGSELTAVQVELSYDPSGLSPIRVVQGDFLTNKLGQPKIQNGKITFTYTVALGEKGKSGSGKLATIIFKSLKDNTQITFDKGTMVAAHGKSSNVLASATGTTIMSENTTFSAPINPPVLADIQPAPKTNATAPSRQQNQVTTSNPSSTTTSPTTPIKAPNTRTFDESGNFDYSKNAASTDIETLEITSEENTAFSRFLTFVKSIFGGNE